MSYHLGLIIPASVRNSAAETDKCQKWHWIDLTEDKSNPVIQSHDVIFRKWRRKNEEKTQQPQNGFHAIRRLEYRSLSTAHVNEGGNNSSSTNVVIVLWSHDQLYPPSWLSSKLLGGEKGVLCDFSNRDFFLHALKVVYTSYLVFAW